MEKRSNGESKSTIDFVRMGSKIKEARQNMGLTQEQLSEIVDVTPAFIGHIERGERSVSLKTLFAIGKKLKISFDYLLSEISYSPEEQTIKDTLQLLESCSPEARKAVLDIVRVTLKHLK